MEWNKEKIRAYRRKLNLTQGQFAELLGTSRRLISYWERGKINPSGPSQKALSLIAGVTDIEREIEKIKSKKEDRISSEEISAFREKLSLSQTEFARLLGRNHSTVSYWESGEKGPGKKSFLLLKKLAEKEGIDLEKLDTEVKEVSLDDESVGKQSKGKTSEGEDCDTDSSETSNRGGANFTTASPADPDIKKVACGIDVLYLSYYVEVNEKLLSHLAEAKAEAEDMASSAFSGKASVPIDIGDYTFNIKSYGLPRYAYILSNGDLWLQVAKENTESYPNLYVQMNSLYILETGVDSAVNEVRTFISSSFGEITKEIVSRVEMYVDIAGEKLNQGDVEKFVSRADCEIYIKGGSFTGFTIGSGDIKAKVYNKKREIKKSHKEYMYEIWEDVSEDEEVWRIEFSLSRRALREWGVEAFESFKEIAGDIWKYLTEDWLSMREQDNENQTRRSKTSLWEEVCSTREFFGKVTGAVRNSKRIGEIEQNISVIKGCYTSIGAKFYNMGVDMSFDGVSTLVTTGIKERLAGKYGDSDLSLEDIEALSSIGFAQEVYRKAVYA